MNKELITISKKPQLPTNWNYDKSVSKVKQTVYKWKNLTTDLATELWIAREMLSSQGARTDIKEKRTWSQYCEDIGSQKDVVNRWITRSFNLTTLVAKLPTPELPKGKYQVIYADPPWQYGQEQHGKEEQETVLESHYPTMPTEDICKLPVTDLVADNAVLFLWTTSPKLFEAKQVIDAWGFDYKSSMIWDKVKHNVGYYVSVRHEFLLICTKGSCLPDSNKLIDSVQTIERSNRHSEKPERFYEIIEEMYKGKKIELFSRNKRKNWEVWGNQI